MPKLTSILKKHRRYPMTPLKSKQQKSMNREGQEIHSKLIRNVNYLKEKTGNSQDLIFRTLTFMEGQQYLISIGYIAELTEQPFIEQLIQNVLMKEVKEYLNKENTTAFKLFQYLKHYALPIDAHQQLTTLDDVFDYLFNGDIILFIDGVPHCLVIGAELKEGRGVEEPTSQTLVRGPKDGFTETISVNKSLIRRRIKVPDLWMDKMIIGRKTKTEVAIVYLETVADKKMVDELKSRMKKVDIDGLLEGGQLEEYIQDATFTPFPTIMNTERPDAATTAILDGKIVVIVDGSPFVLILPAVFANFFETNEDYYQRVDISTALRILRYLAFFLALLVPSLYIAVTTYHQEMLPTALLISLAAQREGIPFPAIIEVFMMEIAFEILREAGIRLPRAVGSAISIVGGLVLGQTAVEAGIVSSAMVIVVSLTAISNFVSPSFNLAISVRLLRFLFIILGGILGLYGIILGLIGLVLHLTSLRSFGVPYMTPFAPFILKNQKNTLLRFPLWALRDRSLFISKKNTKRANTEKPAPPSKGASS
ncbi:spore germination protein [Alkalihalobacillus pseudalcaliphilus]|uniref:spore germination protein n=1 Tax=Alkalihalobacillus pseudalcaliphilus TaxID=79884 RepID=UPI00064DA7DC|nr:spore germination protein [Alkalihalobacillus pseudalcaliphilus]KMK76159.1 spore gernimation protein KA [Alkalihalobacillus pseudalcaliphilus]